MHCTGTVFLPSGPWLKIVITIGHSHYPFTITASCISLYRTIPSNNQFISNGALLPLVSSQTFCNMLVFRVELPIDQVVDILQHVCLATAVECRCRRRLMLARSADPLPFGRQMETRKIKSSCITAVLQLPPQSSSPLCSCSRCYVLSH